MTKSERKKIALRNLKKAWAVKHRKKNPCGNKKRPVKKTNPLKRHYLSVSSVAEQRGPAIVLALLGGWCYENSKQLKAAGESGSASYLALSNKLSAMAVKVKGQGL